MLVPRVPAVDAEQAEEHRVVHARIAELYDRASVAVQLLFVTQQRRIVIESLAHVQPLVSETRE